MSTASLTGRFTHDPDARLDYKFGWGLHPTRPWLEEGETIDSYELFPVGVDVDEDTVTDDGRAVEVWLVDAEPVGRIALVTCRMTTSLGRKDDRTMRLRVTER